jgi:hypothetical protein
MLHAAYQLSTIEAAPCRSCRRHQPASSGTPCLQTLMPLSCGRRYVFRGYSINTRYPSVGLAAQVRNIILNSIDPLPGMVT